MSKKYNHVSYLWDDAKAEALRGNEVDLFIYRSNLLGADLRLTNYGGGNTSVKIKVPGDVAEIPELGLSAFKSTLIWRI